MEDNVYIKRLDVVDSTNRYARDEARTLWNGSGGCDIIAITARHQTAGRGQRGNNWHSATGENLLMSILVCPGKTLKVTEQFLLSQAVALAVHDTMQNYGIDTRLKWPNDIYTGNKKLAGILVELDYSGVFVEQAIIGIGVNVNQCEFPAMERTPVSIKMLLKEEFAVDNVMHDLLDKFTRRYTQLRDSKGKTIAQEYERLLLGFGEECQFIDSNGKFTAVITGVEPCGRLILHTKDGGTRTYAFKEVEMVL